MDEIMAVIPVMPSGGFSLLHQNMREARMNGMPSNMATPQTYYWFYQQVRNHGSWDYQQKDRTWANFGNFNYGATGTAAGIPPNILLMGAGWAQSRAGTSQPEWKRGYQEPPYGDDPRDQCWIQQGIDYAKQYSY
ncbi:polymorphic toxin type 44 domain-containing protein [Brenneria populi subsp. brevivirga]|uniref:polymorphic toxin type 44 domain-containing protein n=1 Tax=Brenneria populi TaxID=1505588 RepID=UPI002E19F078|nr:polymorphic toxin type 44 domain-containing protein [Brenneria populi subsp. brevivirga]